MSVNVGGIFSTDLTLEGSLFQKVGASAAKTPVPIIVLTRKIRTR